MEYIDGCLIQAVKNGDVDFMAHCCNCQGVMGSGIALQVKNEFPRAYEAYRAKYKICKEYELGMLGGFQIAGKIINIFGQVFYGKGAIWRYGNYGAIASAFSKLQKHGSSGGQKPVLGIPYNFASDRAGCEWIIILELIEHLLCPYFDVKVYKLK